MGSATLIASHKACTWTPLWGKVSFMVGLLYPCRTQQTKKTKKSQKNPHRSSADPGEGKFNSLRCEILRTETSTTLTRTETMTSFAYGKGFTPRANALLVVSQPRRFVAQNDQAIEGFGMLARNVLECGIQLGICSEFARNSPGKWPGPAMRGTLQETVAPI